MDFENRFCPNCGSAKVEPDTRHTNVLGEMIFNPNKWFCKECDYAGLMPTKGDEDQGIDFEPVENEKIDKSAGKALIYYYFVALGLLLLFALGFIILL